MARGEQAALLLGLLCVALVALSIPSFLLKVQKDRIALLQTPRSAAKAEFQNARKELGSVLKESMDITNTHQHKAAPAAKAILSQAKSIDAEARTLKFLEDQVKHRAEVVKKTAEAEHKRQQQLRLDAKKQLEPMLKEEAVANSLYQSSLQKLRKEQAAAAALMHDASSASTAAAAKAAHRVKSAAITAPKHAHKLAASKGAAKQSAGTAQAQAAVQESMKVSKDGSLALLSPKDGKFHMPLFPGPQGVHSAPAYPPKQVHDPGCTLPKIYNKDLGCYDDPRSEPLPKYCRMEPQGDKCKKYHAELEGRVWQYFVDLRNTYPYRYHRHFYQNKQATHAKHIIQPQRYPHKDGADLGDNYISGFHDRSKGHADLDDNMVSGHDLKSHSPLVLAPFNAIGSDDARGPRYKEVLKPPIAAMEKKGQTHAFDDDIVKWDHHENFVRAQSWPTHVASRDRIEPAGKHEQQILKGYGDEKVDPLGINEGLKDQEVPAGKVYKAHRGHNYWREDEGEPFSDFILGGWGGWKGQDVLPKDAQKKNEDKWDDDEPLDDSFGADGGPKKKKAAAGGDGGGDKKVVEEDPFTPDKKMGFMG